MSKVSRRTFISGSAALAALAIAGPNYVSRLTENDLQKLLRLIHSGWVEGYTFDMRGLGSAVFDDLHHLTITRCTFYLDPGKPALKVTRCSYLMISHCNFIADHQPPEGLS